MIYQYSINPKGRRIYKQTDTSFCVRVLNIGCHVNTTMHSIGMKKSKLFDLKEKKGETKGACCCRVWRTLSAPTWSLQPLHANSLASRSHCVMSAASAFQPLTSSLGALLHTICISTKCSSQVIVRTRKLYRWLFVELLDMYTHTQNRWAYTKIQNIPEIILRFSLT